MNSIIILLATANFNCLTHYTCLSILSCLFETSIGTVAILKIYKAIPIAKGYISMYVEVTLLIASYIHTYIASVQRIEQAEQLQYGLCTGVATQITQ